MQKDGVLFTNDVAALFAVSLSTVQRWARQGDLTAHKVGRRWTFEPEDLCAFWLKFVGGFRSSENPSQDFARFRQLVQELEQGEAVGFEAATQREILEVAQRLLATGGPRVGGLGRRAQSLVEHLRENPKFAFLELVPDFAHIQ